MLQVPFKNRYLKLGEHFYQKVSPGSVASPSLIKFNTSLAEQLGIEADPLNTSELESIFSGNCLPEGAEPIAMAYAGHQFGNFVPQLGDGRAILLGEVDGSEGKSYAIQLKGSGPTAFSRDGDGRAALGPILREYLVSEAMAALGMPTTRALAAVATGDKVAREKLLPGGIITRVASSFVRVGTFQYFSARDDMESVKALADFVIEQNYPRLKDSKQPYRDLLKIVMESQAALIAQWMQVGFIHGVMNTDNMSVAGETIDYGPCAFMDTYQHDQVYSYIDRMGRYAYDQQPQIGLWNLIRFAECLIPLLHDDGKKAVEIAQEILERYRGLYENYWLRGMRGKCGLSEDIKNTDEDDRRLIEELLLLMEQGNADFTLSFYFLSKLSDQADQGDDDFISLFEAKQPIVEWLNKWRERLTDEAHSEKQRQLSMQSVNPVYIPRNHQIEAAIRAAEDHGDFCVFHDLLEVLQSPYSYQSDQDRYLLPPNSNELVLQTFCGT